MAALLTLSVETEGVLEALDKLEMDTVSKLTRVLDMVGSETVAYLRSLTDEMRPPVGAGASRRAHPGHWADVTSNLANAYAYDVVAGSDFVTLALSNSMEYAIYLEARDGFFVLSGVTDPGGPVERALRTVAARVAPEWEIVS